MSQRAYIEHLKNGPFPGRIDPWAEAGRYFQQIHSGMIDQILVQIQDPLLEMGYIAGKETSLQIIENRQPDIFIRKHAVDEPKQSQEWDYAAAAQAIMAEPGIEAEELDLQAIYIRELKSSQLITVLEIVSPRNKTEQFVISEYQQRRNRLLNEQHVNVVEIDATRSVKRLLDHTLTHAHLYHIAIYLPFEWPRVLWNDFEQPLKRVALPLRGQVVAVEPELAYNYAYRSAAIAGHIENEGRYQETELPFPTLLTPQERQQAAQAVEEWRAALYKLQAE